jgi:hypothetical protein
MRGGIDAHVSVWLIHQFSPRKPSGFRLQLIKATLYPLFTEFSLFDASHSQLDPLH